MALNVVGWGDAGNYGTPAEGVNPYAAQQRLTNEVGQLAPLAINYHTPAAPSDVPFVTPRSPNMGVVPTFFHKIGQIGSEAGHIGGGAVSWLSHAAQRMITSPARLGSSLGHLGLDSYDSIQLSKQNDELSAKLDNLHAQFAAGRISGNTYRTGLKELNQDFNNLINAGKANHASMSHDAQLTVNSGIDTAVAVLTVLTAGAGSAATPELSMASRYLLSSRAGAQGLDAVASGIGKLALDEGLMKTLAPAAQQAIRNATYEVVMNTSGRMTASEIAKASAVNLALRYPLVFGMAAPAGHDIYRDLQKDEYGNAVKTLAFNAALILSGGPIGQAFKYGGKALSKASGATFGRTTFLDTLSAGVHNGDPSGLFKAVTAIGDPVTRREAVKALSALEATNAGARGGNEIQGAYRILDGLKAYDGVDPRTQTHEEFLQDILNWHKAQNMADEVAKKYGLGTVAVGRTTARLMNTIADTVSAETSVEARLNAWEGYKANFPNSAAANNANLDRQIKHLIQTNHNDAVLRDAIANVKASWAVKGFPEAEVRKLAKLGYVPIKPVSIEAPFQEGTGKLASKFAHDEEGFMRVSQPLPVLSSVGAMLVKSGLSPNVAPQRIYDVFNKTVANKLEETGILRSFGAKLEAEAAAAKRTTVSPVPGFTKEEVKAAEAQGMTPEMLAKGKVSEGAVPAPVAIAEPQLSAQTPNEVSDYIIKKLSNYAKHPTRGGYGDTNIRPPITDLRQLTRRDIEAALGITRSEAKQVQGAIMDSFIQVPLEVGSLGDKIMAYNYKYNPLASPYARIQGAGRFSWNPVFQAKLAYKGEFLSQATTGGKFPTFLGTNTFLKFFYGNRYKEFDAIAKTLNEGFYDAGLGMEAADTVTNTLGGNLRGFGNKYPKSAMRGVAGVVKQMADNAGLDAQTFMHQFPGETRDAVQTVLGYNPKASFLNSPLTRTLNMAFFPFRFNVKVASIMAKALSKADPMTQYAVVVGMLKAKDYLRSDAGQAWYSQNSDIIGLFKYFSPVATLSEIAQALGQKPHSTSQYGELGGLPFGWIPQLLDSEGLTHFGQAYVNPKTGAIAKDYVPVSARGYLHTAIVDFLGSLFSYPGATVGLPSKSQIESKAAGAFTNAGKTDFEAETPGVTPSQSQFQRVVQQTSPEAQAQPQAPTTTPPAQAVPVPPQPSPITMPKIKPASSGGAKKKKKTEFVPQLLPGQSYLGQL